MTSPPSGVDAREQCLHAIIAVYLEADQAGQHPCRQELLDRHPDLAPELQAFFADHDNLKRWAEPRAAAPRPAGAPRAPAAGTQVRYVGDYELLDEIACGGMGVVYRARQRSLNRLVALKMIRAGVLASAAEIQRFRGEAEAAANLDHPNVVPIYEVGDYQGQPYFTMKYIEGGNLTQHVPRLLDEPQAAAQLLATVARAVHHAHERGLLHRDLKPANILLDAQGQPHITDFGLAKRVASLGEAGLTQSGAIVGTPSYMAPEQAAGRTSALTNVADVYSLGAILYELLTDRPPFKAGTPLDTLRQVVEQEPKRPRASNARVPPDLETICLKCLRKEPHARYASAEQLAEDLERFLADRPIRARRPSPLERTRKWVRRHKRVAACAIVLGLGLLVLVLMTQRRRHAQVQEARAEADAQRQRAEANFQTARQAVDELLTRVAEKEWTREPALPPAQRQLLEEALTFYQQVLQEKGDAPAWGLEQAHASLRVAEIQQRLGQRPEAVQAAHQGIALLAKLADAGPGASVYRAQLARAYTLLGNVLVEQGKHQEACRAVEDLTRLPQERWEAYRRAAGVLARCVPLAEKDAALPQEERRTLAQKYAKQAMARLQEAVHRGFNDVEQLKKAADLDALRSRSEFQKLVADLAAKKTERR
jgi:hypothetical protein